MTPADRTELPRLPEGQTLEILAGGFGSANSIAFLGDRILVDAKRPESTQAAVILIGSDCSWTRVPGLPLGQRPHPPVGLRSGSYRMTAHDETLYLVDQTSITAYAGWNGTQFTTQRTVMRANKKWHQFLNPVWGPDDHLYAAASVGYRYEAKGWGAAGIVRSGAGQKPRTVARGIGETPKITFAGNRLFSAGRYLIGPIKPGTNYVGNSRRCHSWLDCRPRPGPRLRPPSCAAQGTSNALYLTLNYRAPVERCSDDYGRSRLVAIRPNGTGRPRTIATGRYRFEALAEHDGYLYFTYGGILARIHP